MRPDKELRVPFNSPLKTNDTPFQTIGCRHTNPDICGSNGLANICAFSREDGICRKPSSAWKKQFAKLNVKNE
ncbi:hypothetical protein [Marasmitruncus massiliensis]|uniref:hypothetical protein n=1 Tax=Marasmitruncus massiliensis TaxID=1944642 RepID=UPI000C7D0805|nr:hypothetical protein [Marasmitruncus massiliensis]